jgi:hypothetical protein
MDQQHPYVQEQLQLAAEKRAEVSNMPVEVENAKVAAHFAFGLASGMMPYLGPESQNDTFVVDVRFQVQIYCVDGDTPLRVRAQDCTSDIYVLYDCSKEWPVPRPVGWIWGARLKKMFNDKGQCECPVDKLLPFEGLVKMLRKHKLLGRTA